MTFYDVISSDSSETATTPEQRRKIRSPTPDNDDLSSLGSYTRTKPIPNKNKKVEELLSEESAARRAMPPEIFYDPPPRQNQLNPEPLTLSDQRAI